MPPVFFAGLISSPYRSVSSIKLLFLRGIHNDLVQICALNVDPVAQSANGDGVRSFLQREEERRGEDYSLVRVALVESVHVLSVAVDNDAADAAKLPRSADAIRRATS